MKSAYDVLPASKCIADPLHYFRPSDQTLIATLSALIASGDEQRATAASAVLQELSSRKLGPEALAELLCPDKLGVLRPWTKIFYNDLGPQSLSMELPTNIWPAHALISEHMARALGLAFLSDLRLESVDDDDDDEEDIGEKLTTRISGILRGYSEERAFLEFLANAMDAGAADFQVFLDEIDHSNENPLISPNMSQLQGPALVLYNDAVFTDADFKGIRRVGLGSKQDSPDSIGQFGLGALSMFHFTEVRFWPSTCLRKTNPQFI